MCKIFSLFHVHFHPVLSFSYCVLINIRKSLKTVAKIICLYSLPYNKKKIEVKTPNAFIAARHMFGKQQESQSQLMPSEALMETAMPLTHTCLRVIPRDECKLGGRNTLFLNHPRKAELQAFTVDLSYCFQLLQQKFHVGNNALSPPRVRIIKQNENINGLVSSVHTDMSLVLPSFLHRAMGFSTSTGT